MNIQVGDRVTFESVKSKEIITLIASSIAFINDLLDENYAKILKIERPKYEDEVIEEKKELLTDEEKEFLKSYIKFVESFKNGKVIEINKNNNWLVLTLKTGIEYQVEVGFKYENIPYYKIALKELGLE